MNDMPNQENPEDAEVREDSLQAAFDASDDQQLAEIVAAISSQEALRQVSLMETGEREELITMLAPEAAAELIEEAPAELAVAMI
ncbi:MAG: hypothetical protein GY802_22135, partial [Gammaproteobacteria bacterium]|nr:hypothetical protein [Gammaproteobacteria bacterium]MCP4983438.1 hypothetical protein [Gammaproteobacteria bacterium]